MAEDIFKAACEMYKSRCERALEAWENYEACFEDKFPNQHAREMFDRIRQILRGSDKVSKNEDEHD